MDTTATRSRRAALAVLCGAMLMVILDGTIVTVALPAVQADLGFDPAQLSWTVNAYLVALGGLLLLAGRIADRVGPRRVLLAGLVLFVAASAACGLAPGPAALVAARFVQGVGAAGASAVVLGMIAALFPEPAERARAMGVYAFVGAAGASLGTVLGGVLTSTVGWRWIFGVNVPIGVAAVVLVTTVVAPDAPPAGKGRLDVRGGGLVTAGLMALVAAVVVEPAGPRAALVVAAVALLAGFVARQRRAADPLVRLAVFRSRTVSGGNAAQLLAVAGMLGFQYVAALYLQQGRGLSPAATGLAMLPIPLVIAAVSLGVSGRAIGRWGARRVLVGGLAVLVAGLLLLAGDVVGTLPVFVLLGVGAGLVLPAAAVVTMSGAGPSDAGLLSGLSTTAQQVGGALGTAALAAVAATGALTAAGAPAGDALVAGFRLAFAGSAAAVAAGLVVAVAVLPRR